MRRLPGFTAEAALDRDARHPGRSTPHRDAQGAVHPAIPPGGPGTLTTLADCIENCMARNRSLTATQCRRACAPAAAAPGRRRGWGRCRTQRLHHVVRVVYGVCLVDSAFLGFPGCRAARNACVSSCRRNVF